jgi:hypothetical protein
MAVKPVQGNLGFVTLGKLGVCAKPGVDHAVYCWSPESNLMEIRIPLQDTTKPYISLTSLKECQRFYRSLHRFTMAENTSPIPPRAGWRKFHKTTCTNTYANGKPDPEGFKMRLLALRKAPLSTDKPTWQPLAASPEGSTNGNEQPEEQGQAATCRPTCRLCRLPAHPSQCAWDE